MQYSLNIGSLDEKLGFFLNTQISQLLILGRNRVDESKSQMRSSSSRSRIACDRPQLILNPNSRPKLRMATVVASK
ncbi:MAG: hypothetical protein JGK17_23115 [Microcoleus sp. PH2017_10_PVI_O_A]|uniref:hypothetical protein n=1 Tax=unclassified Microcoleus TaxID=2642155 RepID=UPI001DF1E5EB|nr:MULTISPECIES: hypothetical protein [unclassified Microcoleus]TAE79299.1 MAG: hypothetical protein EAZ83_22010 [Oscillatoriales cyanobacterium]MCC3408421.1 hypothetical protein [Microcoleus sp. PH2017_10_PVI_O_A]MCC3462503.1 hypothetical protein [Microcoleus sp. PH2017_11_PCY_U_A]MCC3482006.1 hypothetical protein [Microcoleus sp. PH2017_12_PCY_D_A]MCC3531188.1 hypothetical protein [Microcoleus sp. PH2017_21_RUC_O_A]